MEDNTEKKDLTGKVVAEKIEYYKEVAKEGIILREIWSQTHDFTKAQALYDEYKKRKENSNFKK